MSEYDVQSVPGPMSERFDTKRALSKMASRRTLIIGFILINLVVWALVAMAFG